MAALPPGFPKSTTSQGALMELLQFLIVSQSVAISANPQISRVIDSARNDDVASLFTFAGALPVDIAIGGSGEIERTAKITF